MNTTLCRGHTTFALPPTAAAVAGTRRAVLDTLIEWGLPEERELAYTLGLIASELITNAVTHAGTLTPSIFVFLEVDDDGTLELGIRDNHNTCPQPQASSPDATGGRGTAIVDALLTELGGHLATEQHPSGKTVWARLPGLLA
ncbi:ATP-binding protein [Streptomyces sp. 7N604]|uniref:ATP-binding protein n=1 Tax=Streptomyces sp. 7N604 TaxID=3457415 RepID=UPI003FD1583A